MKTNKYLFIALALVAIGCGKTSDNGGHDHNGTDSMSEDPNKALYLEVMRIHDEVMPKDEVIRKLKKELQDKIANTPTMVAEERQKLEKRIVQLDSVSKMMWDWMHGFNPLPDSIDDEKRREYLESEMEKIKKVREAVLETLK